jgi:PAS domain S-box-containing protein
MSELPLATQQLHEAHRKLEEAQRIAHVGHWERDLETDTISWSAEICRIFGISEEQRPTTFQQFLGWLHPEDRARVAHFVAQSVRDLPHYGVDYRIVRADGKERFVHSQGEVLRDKSRRPVRAFGTLQDITERRVAEDKLRQSESQLRLVVDTIPAMAWITLPDGTLEFINRRWLEYTGLSLDEAVAQSTRVIHPEDLSRALEKWGRNMAAGVPFEDEMRLRRADGEYRWFLVRTVPLLDEQRHPVKWYGTSTDIEDRKRAEAALRETQAVLARVTRATIVGELTASIAHEVNQPLGAVVTNANAALRWLEGKPPNLDETRAALQRIVRDGNRASEVVARIRALLKDGAPSKTQLSVVETITEIIALIEPEAHRRQVLVETLLPSDLPGVIADRVQVQQVLMNLMMNALDALTDVTGRRRILIIRAELDSSNVVRVAVEDSGVGVDPVQSERLFEPFYTTKPQGLGMGLAISRSIVEAHGGRLWMTHNQGPGVTFEFTLPLQNGGAT